MPIFPTNPTDQQEETLGSRVFRYNAASGRWNVFRAPSTGSAAITQADLTAAVAEAGGGTEAIATLANLPLTGNASGDMIFVEENNHLYIWNGAGWYNIALINTAPSITQSGDNNYTFSDTSTPIIVTLDAVDPEEVPLVWSYQVVSGSITGTTISNVNNVYTITPSANTSTFELVFTASDGINIATSSSSTFFPEPAEWSIDSNNPIIAYGALATYGFNWVYAVPAPDGAATTNYNFQYYTNNWYTMVADLVEASTPFIWNDTIYTHYIVTRYRSNYHGFDSRSSTRQIQNLAWPGFLMGSNAAVNNNAGDFPGVIAG